MKILVVTNPFAGRASGDEITDPAEVAEVLAGENAGSVVPVTAAATTPATKE